MYIAEYYLILTRSDRIKVKESETMGENQMKTRLGVKSESCMREEQSRAASVSLGGSVAGAMTIVTFASP